MQDKKGTYEYDLEEAKDKKRLFIYFKSGGHVSLDLNRMPKKSADILFRAIESWCISFSRTPVPNSTNRSFGHAPLPPDKPKELRVASFTQMWEDEMQMHSRPLISCLYPKGRSLQTGKYVVQMQLSSGGLSAVYLAQMPDKSLVV